MKIQVSALQLKLSLAGAAGSAGTAGTFSQDPTAQGATSAQGTSTTFSLKRLAVFSLAILALRVPAHADTPCCGLTAIDACTGE